MGYLEPTANSWAYLCAAEAQESLQNSAQLEHGPQPGTRPRPRVATPGTLLGGGMLVAGREPLPGTVGDTCIHLVVREGT